MLDIVKQCDHVTVKAQKNSFELSKIFVGSKFIVPLYNYKNMF